MRAVQLADIEMAARVLLAIERDARVDAMAVLYQNARLADRYRKRTGHPHPDFGSGSLMSAALRFHAAPRPQRCSKTYLDCLGVVITHLAAHSSNQLG